MSAFFYSLIGFVLAICLLTAIHEYGHFWVARCLGVKVLRFSIGFGKTLFSWYDKRGTEYSLSAIPLGGYVKMLDEHEGAVPSSEMHLAFNNKSVWRRMLIIVAGPVHNLLFALLAYWLAFMLGISSVIPILGDISKDSMAYLAGLRSGQAIVSIDAQPVYSWEDVLLALVSHAGDNSNIDVTVRNIDNNIISEHVLTYSPNLQQNNENLLEKVGFEPLDPVSPIIAKVLPSSAALVGGLQAGDRIISLNSQPVTNRTQVIKFLQNTSEQAIPVTVLRDNTELTIYLTPINGKIGIQFVSQPLPENFIYVQHYAVLPALFKAYTRTKEYTVLTFQFLGKIVIGKISMENIGGPIAIAQYAGKTVQSGIEHFLEFLALISISLGVLNLLPIPILDGGHLLYCIIEIVRGKELSARAKGVGNAIGFAILGCVLILAFYNDIVRILG